MKVNKNKERARERWQWAQRHHVFIVISYSLLQERHADSLIQNQHYQVCTLVINLCVCLFYCLHVGFNPNLVKMFIASSMLIYSIYIYMNHQILASSHSHCVLTSSYTPHFGLNALQFTKCMKERKFFFSQTDHTSTLYRNNVATEQLHYTQ